MIILNEEDLVIYLKESVVNRSRIVGIFDFVHKIVDKVRFMMFISDFYESNSILSFYFIELD